MDDTKQLPDDVILSIVAVLDINTFFNFRATSHRYHQLIDSHIHGLTESVARAAFEDFDGDIVGDSVKERLAWLNKLRYEYLAAIVIEIQPTGSAVAAQDPLCADLRSNLAAGWRTLNRLSKVAHKHPSADLYGPLSSPRLRAAPTVLPANGMEAAGLAGTDMANQWLALIGTLSIREIKAYEWLQELLIGHLFGFTDPWDRKRLTWPAVAWVWSCVIRMGPEPFWKQWRQRAGLQEEQTSLREIIEAEWQASDQVMPPRWYLDSFCTVDRGMNLVLLNAFTSAYAADPTTIVTDSSAYWIRRWLSTRDVAHARQQAIIEGEIEPRWMFRQYGMVEKLDWKMFGYDYEHEKAESEMHRQMIMSGQLACCFMGDTHCLPTMSKPFEDLLRIWEGKEPAEDRKFQRAEQKLPVIARQVGRWSKMKNHLKRFGALRARK